MKGELVSTRRQQPRPIRAALNLAVSFAMTFVRAAAFVSLLFLVPTFAHAEAKRVVVIKVDGLPDAVVAQYVNEKNPATGKSVLPWIDHIFYQRGTRIANFYVRGMSLSGPSWSLLDTGQHLQIKGNVEFDRYTLHSYDYLNFIPFYINYAMSRRTDMPGVEVLDELGIPLLSDAYQPNERYVGMQVYIRGLRWSTLGAALPNRILGRSARDLVDEWTVGVNLRNAIYDQFERDLIQKLNDPSRRYLDYYTSEFDHRAHHNRDRASQLLTLQELDGIVGRIWTAIQNSPMADDTVLVLVSDHGINTDDKVYSQGFNLVHLLGSAEGGGHHVVTKRRLLLDYALKGVYPLVALITTTTPDTKYLKGQSTDYPTVLVDFDGNERSSLHFRDSDLNLLQILLQQLQRKNTAAPLRKAITDAFFDVIDRRRNEWQADLTGLNEELAVLRGVIAKQEAIVAAQPKKWSDEDKKAGRDETSRRMFARMDSAKADDRDYTIYVRTLTNLLALNRDTFDPSKIRVEDVIAKHSMGDRNTIGALQNYIVGPAPGGMRIAADGSLDMQASFERVNYFEFLHSRSVKNNVQEGVASHPIDFLATRIPLEQIAGAIGAEDRPDDDVVWIYGGREQQALILSRMDRAGRLSLKYLPIANLVQDESGSIRFEKTPWRAGLALKILEDKQLNVPESNKLEWLSQWHTDIEWLHALHKTEYSNALIGLQEQLVQHPAETLRIEEAGLSIEERLMRRFRTRQRQLVEADMLVLANNHWNFDVRGFNPGGNHGSFFRISTHSTLMMAGGARTGVARGMTVEEPYDSLSFVPTMLALTGQLDDQSSPIPALWQRGFRRFPGRIITEVVRPGDSKAPSRVAVGGTSVP